MAISYQMPIFFGVIHRIDAYPSLLFFFFGESALLESDGIGVSLPSSFKIQTAL
jgi:hypothetical protein